MSKELGLFRKIAVILSEAKNLKTPLDPSLRSGWHGIPIFLLLQLTHNLRINFLGSTNARENKLAGFDAKFTGSQINLGNIDGHMSTINRSHNYTVFGMLIRNSPHNRQDFMSGRQQLFLAFAADTFKSIPAYGIPADCPGTAGNQKDTAAGENAQKNRKKNMNKFD